MVIKICLKTNSNFEEIVNENNERLGKDLNYLLDSQKLRKSFNWNDKISLEEGLDLTLDWIKSNLISLKNLPWEYKHKL